MAAAVAQLANALDIKLAARLERDVLSISLEFAG